MAATYLLDTNICIYIAKNHPIQVMRRFEQLQPGDVAMSFITYGELGVIAHTFTSHLTPHTSHLATHMLQYNLHQGLDMDLAVIQGRDITILFTAGG